MSTTTPNLGLFKYDTTSSIDLASAFNINTALNNNWDKIDLFSQNIDVLPDQTGKSGYLLTTNGTTASWGQTFTIYPIIEVPNEKTIEWCRKYSDGWCECGGQLLRSATGILNVTLPISFINTEYHVQATNQASPTYTTATTFYTPYVLNKTVSGFSLSSNANKDNIAYFVWEAKGYIS